MLSQLRRRISALRRPNQLKRPKLLSAARTASSSCAALQPQLHQPSALAGAAISQLAPNTTRFSLSLLPAASSVWYRDELVLTASVSARISACRPASPSLRAVIGRYTFAWFKAIGKKRQTHPDVLVLADLDVVAAASVSDNRLAIHVTILTAIILTAYSQRADKGDAQATQSSKPTPKIDSFAPAHFDLLVCPSMSHRFPRAPLSVFATTACLGLSLSC